jgi:hypothetical protein
VTRLPQHLPPDLDDRPGFFGDRDEDVRGHHRPIEAAPPGERLQRGGPRRPQVDDRLVVHLDLAEVDGASQLLLQADAPRRPDPHGRFEHLHTP